MNNCTLNSTLRWHDARQEKPPNGTDCLVVHFGAQTLFTDRWIDGEWASEEDMERFGISVHITHWAALPTAACVRQKFKNEELKNHA